MVDIPSGSLCESLKPRDLALLPLIGSYGTEHSGIVCMTTLSFLRKTDGAKVQQNLCMQKQEMIK